jgi:hypothetical protein
VISYNPPRSPKPLEVTEIWYKEHPELFKKGAIQMNDSQDKLNKWYEWSNQSSEYKLANPEPPKPEQE